MGDIEGLQKSVLFKRSESYVPEELRGLELDRSGDNWAYEEARLGQVPSLCPGMTASVAVTVREGGNIVMTAVALPRGGWSHDALAASAEGVFVLTNGRFEKVLGVRKDFLGYSPRLQIFAQKATGHWAEVNPIVGHMAAQGIPTGNDCGPFYAILGWFSVFVDGLIVPTAMAYCEPYGNKPKEELVAYIVHCLNRSLPEEDRFLVTDMSGQPLFEEEKIRRPGEVEGYRASGFLIAPTAEAHNVVLRALKAAVTVHFVAMDEKSRQKMQTLRSDVAQVI